MKDVAIAIMVGSPNSTVYLVKQTFDTIKQNIGNCEWKIFISLGNHVKPEVRDLVYYYTSKYFYNFELFQDEEVSWGAFINKAIEVSHEYRYFVKSHDDIQLLTPDFYRKVTAKLAEINKPVGWVSFTDEGWKVGDFSPPVRPGYHIDVIKEKAWERRKIFQFHLFPENWTSAGFFTDIIFKLRKKIAKIKGNQIPPYPKPTEKIVKYLVDLPKAPVRCHAPFNHFVLIERSVLDRIGKCEDWNTPNALCIDEDWGLRAMALNLPNIWIPDISYFHFRGETKGGGTRSNETIIAQRDRALELFYKKWGFSPEPSLQEITMIQEKYKETLIPWSSYRKSFEWDYII